MIVQTLRCFQVAECDRLPGTFPQRRAPATLRTSGGQAQRRFVPMSSTDCMRGTDLASTLERLGVSDRPFEAGCVLESAKEPWHRARVLESSRFVFAWLEDRSDQWWVDVIYGASIGKRVILAEGDQEIFSGSLWALQRTEHICLSRCTSREAGLFLASVVFAHDPHRKVNSWTWSYLAENIIQNLESPIEARLAVHLFSWVVDYSVCDLVSQRNLLKYRVDFAITNERLESESEAHKASMGYMGPIRVCIECDGHDFHERTKEQAARDKKRDRELATAGWTVLRFTGSEIWKDPSSCVEQVMELIGNLGGSLR